jgi:hypothetical protein
MGTSIGLSLTTGLSNIQNIQLHANAASPLAVPAAADNISSNLPPMVWLPVFIPANSVMMSFDFSVVGDSVEDSLVCGISTNNLFSIQAKYIPTNTFSASRLIDISTWSGTTNELFFGFLGCTSTNATVQIQNIRFYSLQPPQLVIRPITPKDNATLLVWPSTAGGYTVVTTTNIAASGWETITNVPYIDGDSYVFTNVWHDQTRFFRLQP